MDRSDIRFKIAAARRMLYREGCDSQTAGHVSVRVPGEEAFWVTPFQYFDETLPEHVVKSSFELETIEGSWRVSPAVAFHVSIYRRRPDVGAVVHHHGHHTAVVASTGREVGQYNLLASLFFEEQATIRDEVDTNAANDERVASSLGDRSVLLVQNHGAIVVGADIEAATVKGFLLEKAARYHHDCVLLGGTELELENQIRFYKQTLEQYMLREVWDAQLRRLERSDPDLFEVIA